MALANAIAVSTCILSLDVSSNRIDDICASKAELTIRILFGSFLLKLILRVSFACVFFEAQFKHHEDEFQVRVLVTTTTTTTTTTAPTTTTTTTTTTSAAAASLNLVLSNTWVGASGCRALLRAYRQPSTSVILKRTSFLKTLIFNQAYENANDHQLHHLQHTCRHYRRATNHKPVSFRIIISPLRLKQDNPPAPAKYVAEWPVGGEVHIAQDYSGDRFEIILNDAICRFVCNFLVLFCILSSF
jgi:hypothetical protein